MSLNGKKIIVHKTDAEGAMVIDALTGNIVTPADQRPDWADGYATAILAERVGYYEKRMGSHLPDGLRSPEAINVDDLSWVGVDTEGEEVEIEAKAEYRQTMLSTLLGIDTSADSFDDFMAGEGAHTVMVDYTYQTHPTDEQTLAEAEGENFVATESHAVSN
jgi:hypothetical protein